jgi:GT2 family glycosyltransferase
MISFVMPARNAQEWTHRALISLARSVEVLGWKANVHVHLLDDASDPALGIMDIFKQFRQLSGLPTTIVRFHNNQHYSRVLSAALSLATGEKVFFLSNDMVFTPEFFKTLHDVSNLDPAIGIVRGTSTYTDSHPEHTVTPPFQLRTLDDVVNFSRYVFSYWQMHFVEDKLLSGDAVLFNRKLIDKIGVVDTRYFGYFGDVDYGLRAIRAGFKLVCAKGAWIFHEGGGYVRDTAIRTHADPAQLHAKRMMTVQQAYDQFRNKWDPNLPAKCQDLPGLDVPDLKRMEPVDLHQYLPPLVLTPEVGEIVGA